jgi:hypothetical protein
MSEGWDQGPSTPAGLPGWAEETEQPASWSRQTAVFVGAGALAVLALIGALVLVLSGGGDDSATPPVTSSGPTSAAPTSAAPTSAAPTTSAPPTVSPPPVLTDIPADRKDVGFLRSVQVVNGSTYLAFDRIQFLTGDAAAQAAAKAGQEATNDYFIVNSNLQLRNAQLAKAVQVKGSAVLNAFAGDDDADPSGETPRTLEELTRYVQERGADDTTPFRFTYAPDGTVAVVAEQFVP